MHAYYVLKECAGCDKSKNKTRNFRCSSTVLFIVAYFITSILLSETPRMMTVWSTSLRGRCEDRAHCCARTFCPCPLVFKSGHNLGKSGVLYSILGVLIPCLRVKCAGPDKRRDNPDAAQLFGLSPLSLSEESLVLKPHAQWPCGAPLSVAAPRTVQTASPGPSARASSSTGAASNWARAESSAASSAPSYPACQSSCSGEQPGKKTSSNHTT